jgi:hypothetical protein
VPQNKKDCQITLQHPSYIKLYEILKRYKEPDLRDIFLQQVAYNCAIRLVALDFMGETDGLIIKLSNLAEYGLDTYSQSISVLDHDVSENLYDIDKLILDFPFFDSMKTTINNAIAAENGKRSSQHQTYTSISTLYGGYNRYPMVQKVITPAKKEKLMELLQAEDHGEAFVLPIESLMDQKLPDCLKDDNGNTMKLDALQITQAFYYFDAIKFYEYTKSMISRSLTYPDSDTNQNGHGFPKLITYLKVIEKYILQKSYFDLI